MCPGSEEPGRLWHAFTRPCRSSRNDCAEWPTRRVVAGDIVGTSSTADTTRTSSRAVASRRAIHNSERPTALDRASRRSGHCIPPFCASITRLRATLNVALEPRDDGEPELRRAGAVDHAVVERHADRPRAPDDDLAVAYDGPVTDAADGENRDLRVVDDRRREQPAELAGARDGERRAAELLRCQFARSPALRQLRQLFVDLIRRSSCRTPVPPAP